MSVAAEQDVVDDLKIVLIHSGVELEPSKTESEQPIRLMNGSQEIDARYKMRKTVTDVHEEEFVFNSLGEPVSG